MTDEFAPRPGGLEISLLRLAQLLSERNEHECIVYIRSDLHDYRDATHVAGVRIVPLSRRRAIWEEPLAAVDTGPRVMAAERCRLDFVLLRDCIRARVVSQPLVRHVIISFFIHEHGFVAQQVASALNLPHIACIRGTDFSRGFHDPVAFPAIDYVARTADLVVTTNEEQRAALLRRGVARVRTIASSLPVEVFEFRHHCATADRVRLFANCGYSHKKGTQVLLRAFAALRDDGVSVELTLTGADDEAQASYWEKLRLLYAERFGTSIKFMGHVPEDGLHVLLRDSDVYCSATLGEGCSLARLTALATGMPIVTTSCGEMQDLATGLSHVRLAPVADDAAFTATLRDASLDVLHGRMYVDWPAIEHLREFLLPARERAEWVAALESLESASDAETRRLFRA